MIHFNVDTLFDFVRRHIGVLLLKNSNLARTNTLYHLGATFRTLGTFCRLWRQCVSRNEILPNVVVSKNVI